MTNTGGVPTITLDIQQDEPQMSLCQKCGDEADVCLDCAAMERTTAVREAQIKILRRLSDTVVYSTQDTCPLSPDWGRGRVDMAKQILSLMYFHAQCNYGIQPEDVDLVGAAIAEDFERGLFHHKEEDK